MRIIRTISAGGAGGAGNAGGIIVKVWVPRQERKENLAAGLNSERQHICYAPEGCPRVTRNVASNGHAVTIIPRRSEEVRRDET